MNPRLTTLRCARSAAHAPLRTLRCARSAAHAPLRAFDDATARVERGKGFVVTPEWRRGAAEAAIG